MFCAGSGARCVRVDKVAVFSTHKRPLSTYCKIRYISKFIAALLGSPCDSMAFLLADRRLLQADLSAIGIMCLCLSVTLCIVAQQYLLQLMSEQVNTKWPPRNTTVQLSTP